MLSYTLVAAAALVATARANLYNISNLNHTCVIEPSSFVQSCGAVANATANVIPPLIDTCCSETYGGLVLSTQYWDTYTGLESQGQLLPNNSWTLHGLWPDFCNGSYTQYCDLSRQFDPSPSPNTTNGLRNGTVVPPYTGPSISTFITDFGRYDLLAWMNKYWVNQGASNAAFWGHEFSKHGTCYSTFDLPCYGPKYTPHEDVIDFFQTAILYYSRLPTYRWLAAASIVPSNATTYSLSDIQGTLTKAYGAVPYIGCTGPKYNTTAAGAGSTDNGYTIVDEVWYYSHVLGKPQYGMSTPVNATSPNTSCAKTPGALRYLERTPSSVGPA